MQTYKKIVVLTGAGVSAESGLKTFRDQDGLWENHRIEDVCTPEAFIRDPALVHGFYNARRAQLLSEARPNAAHLALARFEHEFAGEFTLVTQNVDNLHEQAGSEAVIHMHGELLKVSCTRSGKSFAWREDTDPASLCPCCQTPGTLRPAIVWFGEIPLAMERIERALSDCDLFVAIGTSGAVYPAAGFVRWASLAGAHTVLLNLEAHSGGQQFDEVRCGPASETVPAFFRALVPATAN